MPHESDFPSVEDIYLAIKHLPSQVEPEFRESDDDEPAIEVRLQVWPDGQWTYHTGSADYDQDHRGYWGSGSVTADMDERALRALAEDLREQSIEQCAESDELAEDAGPGFGDESWRTRRAESGHGE